MRLTVYLAGQIHDQWRSELKAEAEAKELPIDFVGPMENHDRSDAIGEEVMGKQGTPLLRDAAASQINNLRTQVLVTYSHHLR
jgi:YtoQ family protein